MTSTQRAASAASLHPKLINPCRRSALAQSCSCALHSLPGSRPHSTTFLEQACELAAGFIFLLLHAHTTRAFLPTNPLRLTPSHIALPPTSAQLLPHNFPPLLNFGRTFQYHPGNGESKNCCILPKYSQLRLDHHRVCDHPIQFLIVPHDLQTSLASPLPPQLGN
jgi:hypothetical protein